AHAFHAHAAFNSGLDDEAEREFQEGLAGFQATGDRWGIAFSLGTLAEAAAGHGEHRAAADYLADALATISELATPEDLCQAQYPPDLLMIGESEQARAILAAAQETADRAGLLECRVQVAYEQGEFARFAGDLEGAREGYERAIAVTRTCQVAPQFHAVMCSALA